MGVSRLMLDVYLNLARPETSCGFRSIERVSSLTAVSAIGHHGSAHHVDGESVFRCPRLVALWVFVVVLFGARVALFSWVRPVCVV